MKRTQQILLLASLLTQFSLGIFGPLYALFVKKIGGDILDTGTAYGIFSLSAGILILFVGRTGIFFKHARAVIISSYFLQTVGILGYVFVATPIELFVVQLILGISSGLSEPAWDGLFSANLNEDKAALLWSVWSGGKDIAIGLSAILGGMLLTFFSFRFIFLLMVSVSMLSGLVSLKLVHEKK